MIRSVESSVRDLLAAPTGSPLRADSAWVALVKDRRPLTRTMAEFSTQREKESQRIMV